MSTFIMKDMYDIIASGVRDDKGFKKVHLNDVANRGFEFSATKVTSTRVYTNLRSGERDGSKCPSLETLPAHNVIMTPSPFG